MPIYPNEICPICGENPNLTYLCEECNTVFCEDCVDFRSDELYVCMQCQSTNLKFEKGSPYCEECGSDFIRVMKKLVPICRQCGSENIIKIVDKQDELFNNYKTIISKSRELLIPLENTLQHLYNHRQLLLQVREDSPQCNHYPNLENELLLIFKLFDNAKNSAYDRVNRFFQDIQRNIHYISEIPITHPSNFSYIQEIIQHFDKELEKIKMDIPQYLEPVEEKRTKASEKLLLMENIQALFTAFLPKLQLENDEKIVYGLKCKLRHSSGENGDLNNKNGTILITSRRLYFFQERGMFKKRSVLLFSVKLDDLQQIGVKGRLKKKVSLDFVNSMYQFTISKEKREELIDWIEKARIFETNNILDKGLFNKVLKYRIDIKLFREELENAIYELIGFHGSHLNNTINHNSNVMGRNGIQRTPHMFYQKNGQINSYVNKTPYTQSNEISGANQISKANQFLNKSMYRTSHLAQKPFTTFDNNLSSNRDSRLNNYNNYRNQISNNHQTNYYRNSTSINQNIGLSAQSKLYYPDKGSNNDNIYTRGCFQNNCSKNSATTYPSNKYAQTNNSSMNIDNNSIYKMNHNMNFQQDTNNHNQFQKQNNLFTSNGPAVNRNGFAHQYRSENTETEDNFNDFNGGNYYGYPHGKQEEFPPFPSNQSQQFNYNSNGLQPNKNIMNNRKRNRAFILSKVPHFGDRYNGNPFDQDDLAQTSFNSFPQANISNRSRKQTNKFNQNNGINNNDMNTGINISSTFNENFNPAFEYDPYMQEQLQLQTELNNLQKEEQRLNQTLNIINQRYQSGYMSDAEYVRNYKEMQKQLYINQSRKLQLQNFLQQNYPNI